MSSLKLVTSINQYFSFSPLLAAQKIHSTFHEKSGQSKHFSNLSKWKNRQNNCLKIRDSHFVKFEKLSKNPSSLPPIKTLERKNPSSQPPIKISEMSDTEPDFPDAATAQKLVHEFEGITNTDEALAQFYLQDHDWDLSRALNTYFASIIKNDDEGDTEDVVVQDDDDDEDQSKQSAREVIEQGLKDGTLTTRAPESLKMVTWNIDGLAEKNLKIRTKAVVKHIQLEAADIVFLQEVIAETFSYIEQKLPDYHCIAAAQDNYFVATLLRKGRVYCDKIKVIDFPGTRMYRSILAVKAHCGTVNMDLLNTHLESTKEHAEERQRQLKQCLDICKNRPQGSVVLLGGDLNARDKEVTAVGGLPDGVRDVWQICGSRKEVEFTWDMQRNSNLEWAGKFKPKCRFDRVYLKDSQPSKVKAKTFGLIGLQRITGAQSFPSDHWGISIELALSQGEAGGNKRKIEEV